MSVHNSKPWELSVADYEDHKEVLPATEDVQFMLPGCSNSANKYYLSLCKQDLHREITSLSRVKKMLARSRKRHLTE